MTKTYLFPSQFKKLGWMLLIPFGIALILYATELVKFKLEVPVFTLLSEKGLSNGITFFKIIRNDIVDEIIFTGLIVSLLLISFSKEKDEDEFTSQLRTNSLIWSLLISYTILILSILFIYDLVFLEVLYLNMILILAIYAVKFNITLYNLRKSIKNEEQLKS
jgi:hypothetical protein